MADEDELDQNEGAMVFKMRVKKFEFFAKSGVHQKLINEQFLHFLVV